MTASPPIRLGVFIGGLTVALLCGYLIGKVGGPAPQQAGTGTVPPHGHGGTSSTSPDHHGSTDATGLSISALGYTLVPQRTSFTAGEATPLTFSVAKPGGGALTQFDVAHEKLLHLIVVRRDLTGYQHLHPTMRADGTWEVPVTLRAPGAYRMYADFSTSQTPLTLGADLTVTGDYQPQPLPAAKREAQAQGYDVTYEGTPRIGSSQPLLFRVFTSGSPVVNLERYLGAYGHLIIVREGDLGYVHAHAEPELAGGAMKFWFAAPSPGKYRAFLDFQVGGTVRTAEFTVVV